MKKNENNKTLIIGSLVGLWFLLNSNTRNKNKINSKYYTINDVQKSETAQTNNITQQFAPLDQNIIDNVNLFIRFVLDPLTDYLGEKLIISSWWRSKELNEAVGGVNNSFHTFGLSVDADAIKNGVIDNRRLVKIMLIKNLPFTEMILYNSVTKPTQIHLAFDPNRPNEKEILLKKDGVYSNLDANSLLSLYLNVQI